MYQQRKGKLFLLHLGITLTLMMRTISRVIHELAHQELLQKLIRCIIDCFAPILSVLRAFPAFQSFERQAWEVYLEKKHATPKKIIKLLAN